VGNTMGFNDQANNTTEYAYDTNGSMTKDDNKGISNIIYNMLNKPKEITFTNGRILKYAYSAAGTKLKMEEWMNTTLVRTTDYLGGFVYEDSALKFFGTPEGRVVKNGTAFEYEYAIADHQGNTRVMFSSVTPAPEDPLATFEADSNDDMDQYLNVDPAFIVNSDAANHTQNGGSVIRMNQSYKVGPSKSLKVFPGDKVDMEVWEYHEGASGFGTSSTANSVLINLVSGVFGGVSGGSGESGAIYNGVEDAITIFGKGGNQGTDRPAAYLNFILFDKDYNVLDAGWQLVPDATFTKQKVSFPTRDIEQEGFMFVYLSYDNDSENWVHFDDLKVTHTKTNLIQYNEYYPFGLQTANSWTRENASNNFLYNAGSELNTNSGWYETFFRGYDAALGRFLQVDPLAHMSGGHSPYTYAFNDPVLFNDPMGDYPREVQIWLEQNGTGAAYDYESDFFSSGGGNYVSGVFINPNRPGADGLRSIALNARGVAAGELSLSDYVDMYGTPAQWNRYGGDQITREEWLAFGGDPNKSADLYFSGGWEAQQGGPSPWEVGWEWLTGNGPRHRDFTNGDQFTEMLRQHDHVAATRALIMQSIANGGPLKGSNPYRLDGVQGVGKYLRDYSTLLTGGTTGNLAVTYLGSYVLNWQATVNGNLATLVFTVNNSSTIQSATRPPVLGYTDAWQNTIGAWLNNQLSSGPMSQTTQTFRWTETMTLK
jgi:RHS repeat-associated protein